MLRETFNCGLISRKVMFLGKVTAIECKTLVVSYPSPFKIMYFEIGSSEITTLSRLSLSWKHAGIIGMCHTWLKVTFLLARQLLCD